MDGLHLPPKPPGYYLILLCAAGLLKTYTLVLFYGRGALLGSKGAVSQSELASSFLQGPQKMDNFTVKWGPSTKPILPRNHSRTCPMACNVWVWLWHFLPPSLRLLHYMNIVLQS